ncbi:YtzI protein [Virgibacillus phasianinus]|uniref:YtzI protein n=1 Tax=Virgibacillus phasianinus TaxID=2017483 RepID=A0A220U0A7_9BACI|nr:YtzI protein [Virgibacillus phasianinus]ASK61405.1 YtzI protein [Virgibacillus phasianinus]
MTGYIVLGIIIMLTVLALTLIAINKGYAFKHSIDALPEEDGNEDRTSDYHK